LLDDSSRVPAPPTPPLSPDSTASAVAEAASPAAAYPPSPSFAPSSPIDEVSSAADASSSPPSLPSTVEAASASPVASSSSAASASSESASSDRKSLLDALASRLRMKKAEQENQKQPSKVRTKKIRKKDKQASNPKPAPPPSLRRSSRRHVLHRTVSQETFLQLEAASKKKNEPEKKDRMEVDEQKEEMDSEEQEHSQSPFICSVCGEKEQFGLQAEHPDNFWIQCSICEMNCHAVKCANMTVERWKKFDEAKEDEGEDFVCPSCQMYT
jgi:hypothetical protein